MSDLNSLQNVAVWFDIPVADLGRAAAFYRAVLGIQVSKEAVEGFEFCVLEHRQGNGGCLVLNESAISPQGGILIYLNVNGRLRDAVSKVEKFGGKVMKSIHSIGEHGFRAVVVDSEGNQIALHSANDQ